MPDATLADIVSQAEEAAGKFAGPIQKAEAIEKPSFALRACLRTRQFEIRTAAQGMIFDGPALGAALANLKKATTDLGTTANAMTDPQTIVDNTGRLLSFGAIALGAIESALTFGKLCSNQSSPHDQDYPYPKNCKQCGARVN
jgi:hypothetical protein